MRNSCTSVFSNTRAWEQQEWNKTKKQKKKVLLFLFYRPPGVATARGSGLITWQTQPTARIHPLADGVKTTTIIIIIIIKIIIKICYYYIWDGKKHNEVQLTKIKMYLNNRKSKNRPLSPIVINTEPLSHQGWIIGAGKGDLYNNHPLLQGVVTLESSRYVRDISGGHCDNIIWRTTSFFLCYFSFILSALIWMQIYIGQQQYIIYTIYLSIGQLLMELPFQWLK